jgi:hypothetical protein
LVGGGNGSGKEQRGRLYGNNTHLHVINGDGTRSLEA